MAKKDLVEDKWPYSPKFQEFATFLGVPASKDAKGVNWRYDKKFARKIEDIYKWGKLYSKSEDPLDIMLSVKQLTRELGVSFRGKTLVDHLWGFTQLDSKTIKLRDEIDQIDKEKQLYEDPIEPENADTQGTDTEPDNSGGA
ncbi:MAG: hypothetical protein ACXABY_33985 [Candidatus Thorarchaeota archaeon]|jgi:hypothetical protein